MTPENDEKRIEVVDTPVDDTTQDYISAIKEIKANSVDKQKYEELLSENRKLISNLVNGQTVNEEPVKEKVDIQALRNDLFKEGSDLTNLEFIKKSLDLRDAILEETGNDIFVANGQKIIPTQEDYAAAERVASVFRDCVEYADGDSAVFTNELMRRTKDVPLPRKK